VPLFDGLIVQGGNDDVRYSLNCLQFEEDVVRLSRFPIGEELGCGDRHGTEHVRLEDALGWGMDDRHQPNHRPSGGGFGVLGGLLTRAWPRLRATLAAGSDLQSA
jgi:hypothetical protein